MILNFIRLVGWLVGWLDFMAYQTLLVILYQILFLHILNLRFLNEYFLDNILDTVDLICLDSIKLFQFIIFFVSLKKARTSSMLTSFTAITPRSTMLSSATSW